MVLIWIQLGSLQATFTYKMVVTLMSVCACVHMHVCVAEGDCEED